ncbi:MAG: hypothetical protein ACJAZ3_000783 [Sphingobacteriales bacterium]|jgi:hypothetical protein
MGILITLIISLNGLISNNNPTPYDASVMMSTDGKSVHASVDSDQDHYHLNVNDDGSGELCCITGEEYKW